MTRLPTPGSDDGTWGDILNSYLSVTHAADGTLNSNVIGAAQIQNGSVTSNKLDSSTQSILTAASNADSRYVLQSSLGAASGVATLNSSSKLTSTQLPGTTVTDSAGVNSPLQDAAGNQLVNIPAWQANILYPAGFVVQQSGALYSAITGFTSGSTFNAANWTILNQPGIELGYAQITSNFSTTATGGADVTGLSITITVGTRPFILEAGGPCVYESVAGTYSVLALYSGDGTTQYAASDSGGPSSGAVQEFPFYLRARLSLAAGTYTFKLRAAAGTSSTLNIPASSTAPAWLQAVQI